ncbi:restriction endonuclease subunit S [Acinetobacter calcoaceticus]|uniref:restriction endonuclease subunit S n=1 Tax=Acinetobacter calcoaceticus TaxID=471 RepID=UPI0018FFF5AD|nr:restriction endonuclease subunit S [Acinetobacter calcoaceticus]MBJ9722386.1 restriction endonuclease subunit S [Acinetobacter calcoaceticus]
MEKSKCPEVRFKRFNESWNQQTLGDMFLPLSNNTLSRADLNYDNGHIKNIHYGDILVKYAAVLDCRNDKIPFITDGEISDFKNQFLQSGDVIFADTAEDETVGKAIEISAVDDNYIVSGLHTMAYRPKIKLSPYYLGHYFNSNAYHHQLLSLMQGIKVLSVSRTNLAKTIIKYPSSVTEQTQIGNFFQNFDQSIALQEKKLSQTQNLKKAMLGKMFPKAGSMQPEIRLKGFSGDWKYHELREYCDMFNGDRGGNYPNADDMVSVGIPFINAGDLQNGKVDIQNANKITRDKYNQLNGAKIQFGDIVYCLRGTLGKNAYINNFTEGTVASSLVVIRPKNIIGNFLFQILNSDIEYRQRTIFDEGAAQPNLSARNLAGFLIPIPSTEEQKEIGNFFKQLDEMLILQQQQLQTLKNLKQAFLEKMFV